MTHRPELLSAMLDGELSESESVWVAEHLEGCGQCRTELDDLARARTAVRSLPLLDLPDGLIPSDSTVTPLWPRRVVMAAVSIAAAAALSIGALGMVGMASDSTTSVDVGEAEAILAATASLGVESDGTDAAHYLTSGAHAHYRARQTMACHDGGSVVEGTVDITNMGSTTVMSDPLARLTVMTNGSVATGPVTGPIEAVTVTGPAPTLAGYVVTSVDTDERRDRPTEIVTLGRDGVDRIRLWIDTETGVIMYRELLAADGSVACVEELVEFEPSETPIKASIPFDMQAQVSEAVYEPVVADFPGVLAGLDLVAAYPVAGGEAGIYGDGVFAVAVMRVDGGHPVSTDSDHSPSVVWEAEGDSWAVVGSLPEDMLSELIAGLPAADDPNPFVDGWRRLFG